MGDFCQGPMDPSWAEEPLRFTGRSLQWCSSGLYGTLDRQREMTRDFGCPFFGWQKGKETSGCPKMFFINRSS